MWDIFAPIQQSLLFYVIADLYISTQLVTNMQTSIKNECVD